MGIQWQQLSNDKPAAKWSRQFLGCSLQIHRHSSRYTTVNFTSNICSNRQQKVSQLKVGKVSHFRIVLLDRVLTIFRDFLKVTLGSIIWLWKQKHYSNVIIFKTVGFWGGSIQLWIHLWGHQDPRDSSKSTVTQMALWGIKQDRATLLTTYPPWN